MGRSRYKIYEPTYPHFITCTVLHWIPLFTRKESVEILLESFRYLQKLTIFLVPMCNMGTSETDAMMISKIKYIHHNPVKRGYVDEASHWRYSSARDYEEIDGLLEIERFW